jgi:aldoxime dehydratase
VESAIPPHLKSARTRHRRVADDYQPPYPSFVARHRSAVERVVMAYFGLQHPGDTPPAGRERLARIAESFAAHNGPRHWDRAVCVDEAGFSNVVSVGYWDEPEMFDAWFPAAREEWTGPAGNRDGLGSFIEVLRPSVDRYETLFSSLGRSEGVATLADSMSGEIMEHAYWGGMRDRIPASQTSEMAPGGAPALLSDGARVRIEPHENICLIRSGQDWSDTDAAERRMYLDDVEPVLRAGMDFLRDQGLTIGCFANRYMTVLDRDGRATERSYGMSWWKSLAALERWAESHPTHVSIFGAAMKYLSSLGPAAKLRLYHEVTVALAADQFFEYLNCHPGTGMLKAVAPVAPSAG